MPKGPKGEKRPADVIGAAITQAKIATGEIEEDIDDDGKNKAAVELGRKGGRARAGPTRKVAPTDGEVSHAMLQGEMLRARKVGWD